MGEKAKKDTELAAQTLEKATKEAEMIMAHKTKLSEEILELNKEILAKDGEIKEISKRSIELEEREAKLKADEALYDKDDAELREGQRRLFESKQALEVDKAAFRAFILATEDKEKKLEFERGRLSELEKQLQSQIASNQKKAEELDKRITEVGVREVKIQEKLDTAIQKESRFNDLLIEINHKRALVNKDIRQYHLNKEIEKELKG